MKVSRIFAPIVATRRSLAIILLVAAFLCRYGLPSMILVLETRLELRSPHVGLTTLGNKTQSTRAMGDPP